MYTMYTMYAMSMVTKHFTVTNNVLYIYIHVLFVPLKCSVTIDIQLILLKKGKSMVFCHTLTV